MKFLDKLTKFRTNFEGPGTDFEDEDYGNKKEEEEQVEEEIEIKTEPKREIRKEPEYKPMNEGAKIMSNTATQPKIKTSTADQQINFAIRRPNKFTDVDSIATDIIEGRTVAVNLESIAREDAKRIFDFLSGVVFAVKAQIEPVADNTYVIVPGTVNFTAQELKEDSDNNTVHIDD